MMLCGCAVPKPEAPRVAKIVVSNEPEPEVLPEEEPPPDDPIEVPPLDPSPPLAIEEAPLLDDHDHVTTDSPVAPPGAVMRRPTAAGKATLARTPRLIGRLDCKHPAEATANGVGTATVTLRVALTDQGVVMRTTIVSDPGFGFGAAAAACIKTARFEPARNELGAAVATVVPLNVRFADGS